MSALRARARLCGRDARRSQQRKPAPVTPRIGNESAMDLRVKPARAIKMVGQPAERTAGAACRAESRSRAAADFLTVIPFCRSRHPRFLLSPSQLSTPVIPAKEGIHRDARAELSETAIAARRKVEERRKARRQVRAFSVCGMVVETGEGRTPRPEDCATGTSTSLADIWNRFGASVPARRAPEASRWS